MVPCEPITCEGEDAQALGKWKGNAGSGGLRRRSREFPCGILVALSLLASSSSSFSPLSPFLRPDLDLFFSKFQVPL